MRFPGLWREAGLPESITVSMGLVWASANVPQREALQHARDAEASAKARGRDRFALRLLYASCRSSATATWPRCATSRPAWARSSCGASRPTARSSPTCPLAPAAGICLAFLLACLAGRDFPGVLNGSLAYAPTLAVLALLAWHQLRQEQSALLLAATGLFSLSLLLRSVDNALCPLFPIGTHLFWHLFNAEVLVLSGRALLASQQNGGAIPAGRRSPFPPPPSTPSWATRASASSLGGWSSGWS